MTIELRDHPFALVNQIATEVGIEWLSFSQYLYRPQAILDQRVLIVLESDALNSEWFHSQLASLEPEWELAMNSTVVDARGRRGHIGMVDFVGFPDVDEIKRRFWNMVGKTESKSLVIFNSGRSYHGYVPLLMGPRKWQQFMARLLLLNLPDAAPIVDSRWVGHRLLGGYAALRWSANSRHHQSLPSRLHNS